MKKILVVAVLVLVIGMILSPAVQAAGWFKTTTSDTVGDYFWGDYNSDYATTTTPHLGFSTGSNKCRVCHAVHEANENSFRLLKNGNTTETRSSGERAGELGMGNKRSTECMYCHDANSGASDKKPYGIIDQVMGRTVRGEHSLGADTIPDSSVNDTSTQADGLGNLGRGGILDCYQCHSVHGANILTFITGFGWGQQTKPIDNFILRDDPAGNGGDANDGISSILAPYDTSDSVNQWNNGQSKDTSTYPSKDTTAYDEYSIWKYEIQAAWCGDCHNENPNITGPGDFRPNGKSHPIFGGGTTETTDPFSGGFMEVYGTTMQVSGAAPKGCEQCHMSGQKMGSQSIPSWPHQAEGAKFLVRSETASPMTFLPVEEGVKSGPGDSQRVIPRMDKACLWCHRFNSGAEGVGLTF